MIQCTVAKKLAHQFKNVAVVAAMGLFSQSPAFADPWTNLTPWTDPWPVTFNQTTYPLGTMPAIFGNINPMWYCGDENINSCEADTGPLLAAFRYQFAFPVVERPYIYGDISIRADDYYSLYINNKLIGFNWLDLIDPQVGYDHYDISNYLKSGSANEILIFACDGRLTDNSESPGPIASNGWGSCTTPSLRGNHYLLVEGLVSQAGYSGLATPTTFNLRGGEPSNWQVSTVPEPGTLALILPAMLLSFRLTRKQKKVNRFR